VQRGGGQLPAGLPPVGDGLRARRLLGAVAAQRRLHVHAAGRLQLRVHDVDRLRDHLLVDRPVLLPADRTIYIDLGFYDLLQSQYGASGGSLAEMYVVAHEYGHHIQQITGVMDQADRQGTGAESDSVKTELQADCYAGLWTGHAASTVDTTTGVTFLDPITQAELSDALSAAQAVGDDHIQQQSSGGVNPDTWTHGSSAERQRWFMTGYTQGTLAACDTFSAPSL